MARLEASERRAIKAEQEKKELELAQARQGLKVMEKVWGVQDQLAKARQDAVVYKARLEFAEAEMYVSAKILSALSRLLQWSSHHERRNTRNLKEKLEGVERAAQETRAAVRRVHEGKLALLAWDEGRKQSFAEGISRAREVYDDMWRVKTALGSYSDHSLLRHRPSSSLHV